MDDKAGERDKPLGKAMCMHCFLRWDGVDVYQPTLLDDLICPGCDAVLTLNGETVTGKFIGGELDGDEATNRLMTNGEVERAEEIHDSSGVRPDLCNSQGQPKAEKETERRIRTMPGIRTLKEAKAAGYHRPRPDDYGGDRIEVKGRVLVKDAKRAKSKTEWSREGFRVKADAQPHGMAHFHSHGKHIEYPICREDQVEPKRKATKKPPQEICVLAAVWVINRYAKRCRDAAQSAYANDRHTGACGAKWFSEKKATMYGLKSQALHHLVADGKLAVVGYHRFGENWAEVLSGGGYTFHRPCPPPGGPTEAKELDGVEAKPRGAKEPRLKDALHTITLYLEGKANVRVYQWPAPFRARFIRARYDDEDYEDDEWDEEDDWSE